MSSDDRPIETTPLLGNGNTSANRARIGLATPEPVQPSSNAATGTDRRTVWGAILVFIFTSALVIYPPSANFPSWRISSLRVTWLFFVPVGGYLAAPYISKVGRHPALLSSILAGLSFFSFAVDSTRGWTMILLNRTIQSLLAGAVLPLVFYAVTSRYPAEKRGSWLGVISGLNTISDTIPALTVFYFGWDRGGYREPIPASLLLAALLFAVFHMYLFAQTLDQHDTPLSAGSGPERRVVIAFPQLTGFENPLPYFGALEIQESFHSLTDMWLNTQQPSNFDYRGHKRCEE
ncbi:hypothetical protein FA15DRAFT_676410 [Coprinopsis marcescibilis]|uniref:MFS general substrate transporter n=1 Tax=Coprinopsis marcescibilis TaxID=230819 RepID=A0A5C3KAR6_COPMA|nr:hypothetical protein FA15DRAFT_676410 [Coprinopsis marcescibilis]